MSEEETKPLRKLFSDPERVKEVEEGEVSDRDIAPLSFVTRIGDALEPPLDKILVEVLRGRHATPEELANQLDITVEQAREHLGELELQGYLERHEDDQHDLFAVSTVWESEEFPSGPVIPLVYQYNLLSDEGRMSVLKQAIDSVITEGDVVADLGAGAGIVSYLAAQQAETVYAVEIDSDVYERGRKLIKEQDVENVEYIKGDARSVSLPEEVDVVVCEMLDTGLIAELQVPVMNHAVDELLKPDGRVIPREAITSIQLVNSNYTFFEGEFKLPHFEAYGSRESTSLSMEQTYHSVTFDEKNGLSVDEELTLEAKESGTVNGVQIKTYVSFALGMELHHGSEWLNPPLTLPTENDFQVTEGECLQVSLEYTLGGGLNNIEYSVTRD